MIRAALALVVLAAGCSSDPPAVAPNGSATDIPPSPIASSASEVDLKRECVTGGAEDVKGRMKIICDPQDDCLNYQGRCFHKNAKNAR